MYETECAAKTIHETLISDDQTGTIATKYKDELELQSKLRHPNIIQFLGIIEFPGSSLPALVTELMHSNMHDFLLRPDMQNAISLSHKRLMLTDIAKGLHYLHKNHIVHRDLTANNVLLTPSLVAKIADLGNSRILPEIEFKKLTTQPGTQVYMPPEANQGYYDDKLDIFSFGHLILFALIQVRGSVYFVLVSLLSFEFVGISRKASQCKFSRSSFKDTQTSY